MQDHKNLKVPQQAVLVRLTPEDWPIWRMLRLQALSDAPYAFGSKLTDWQGTGDREERWRERLATVPLNIVAMLDKLPVGMVSATELDDRASVELISLWVAPSGRGCGVGDALVGTVIEWALEQKAFSVSLDVTEGNERATKLYLRNGFIDMGKLIPQTPVEKPERRLLRFLFPQSA